MSSSCVISSDVKFNHITAFPSESIFDISGDSESFGKFSKILETASLTSFAASLISFSAINSIVTFDRPSLLTEEIDSIPSIPLICASIISVILVSTIFDAAPGYTVSMEISDLSMSGNCLRGILLSERSPINIMKLIKTVQKTGFLIKNSDIFI